MEQVKGLSRAEIASLTSSGWTTNDSEHVAWREARHDELAQTIADLGALYADYANTVFAEPPPPEPDGMPGASTFQRPTGGVFADNPTDTQTPSNTTRPEPGVNTEAVAPVPDDDEDDDEASPWKYSSYDDFDEPSGGLASSGTATALPTGGSPLGGTTTISGGGTTAPGPGLPGAGPGGTGVAPGRGVNPAAPMRGAVLPDGRSGAAGRGGMNPNVQARPGTTSRGSVNAPANGRRNTDENEEEETTV